VATSKTHGPFAYFRYVGGVAKQIRPWKNWYPVYLLPLARLEGKSTSIQAT